MSHLDTGIPGAVTDQLPPINMLKVQLLLEGNEQSAWVLGELPKWINPEASEIEMVQVMENLSHKGWLQAEPETFWETISKRRKQIHLTRDQFKETLAGSGFRIRGSSITEISDEGCHHILDDLAANPQDLVIVATTGHISSFAMRIATHATVPVLVLKRPADGERIKVLLATDGSEASQIAVRKLPGLLRRQNLNVTLTIVLETPLYLENPVVIPYVNASAIDEAMDQNGDMVLETTRTALESNGIQVEHLVKLNGSPAYVLLNQAHSLNPDLIVVGSHNRHGLSEWLLGSVSHRLLQSASPSILVVR